MRGVNVWTTSGFGESDIPDQRGRVALVTGANTGIGWETARALAVHGATVVLGCRNTDRAANAAARIREVAPEATVEVMQLDLGDLDSVSAAASDLRARHDRLDLLINNAGIMAVPRSATVQGFESQIGVNHFGHFALTGQLLEPLLETAGSRVVTVSSSAHHGGRLVLDDLHWERRTYEPFGAYAASKLANLMFAIELQRRLAAAGSETISVAAHPGLTRTDLARENPGGLTFTVLWWLRPVIDAVASQPAATGALPTLRAAVDPGASGAAYYGPANLNETRGPPVPARISRAARDRATAERLWALSVEETGVDYSALASPDA
jgi:NAD(P)-dependent dehydrogenase (short-subunit alcohol dehydrogenase family)